MKILLFFGLKFSLNEKPNYKNIFDCIEEGKRKLAWKIFFSFQENDAEMDRLTEIIFNIKKSICPSTLHSPIENLLFNKDFTNNCIKSIKIQTQPHNKVHDFLINELELFLRNNDVIIKQSDKNAGICIMNTSDYKTEILRQLGDENTYRPSTLSEFNMAVDTFKDKTNFICKNILKDKKLNRIFPDTCKPAKFYVLPKIHKKFDSFPVGRPISSTIKCVNRGVSMLLDSILQPLSLLIPDLLIDSPHLLLLLSNIKLNPTRKYILCTADINAMYLELPISVCKENCIKFFVENKHKIELPINITFNQLKSLLHLTLDYSFLEYDKKYFCSTQGNTNR
ncbi:MAG: hypothetical protein V4547_18415 [Bacteroidota bacterium]